MTEKNNQDQGSSEISDVDVDDVAEERVQEIVDKEVEQGFRGVKTDPTPNEHYTLAGVAEGLPTPETHPEQAAKVGSTKFSATPGAKNND